MGVHEDLTDQARFQRIECGLSEVVMLIRRLTQRVQYLETQVGSEDSSRTVEWREEIQRSLVHLMANHDWEAPNSDDFKRKRFAELGYENILQLAYMLPLETVVDLWQQYAPSKLPATIAPKHRPHADTKDRTLLKHLKGD